MAHQCCLALLYFYKFWSKIIWTNLDIEEASGVAAVHHKIRTKGYWRLRNEDPLCWQSRPVLNQFLISEQSLETVFMNSI